MLAAVGGLGIVGIIVMCQAGSQIVEVRWTFATSTYHTATDWQQTGPTTAG
jgi:hypothetical protein